MKVLPEGSSESAREIELLDEIKLEMCVFDDPDFCISANNPDSASEALCAQAARITY